MGARKLVPGRVRLWIGGGQPLTRPGLPSAAGVEAWLDITEAAVLPR
jgi:beta-glucosidase